MQGRKRVRETLSVLILRLHNTNHRKKRERETAKDKNGASSLGHKKNIGTALKTSNSQIEYRVTNIVLQRY